MVQINAAVKEETMAYQPFVQQRAISQTRPGLEEEESIRNKAKAAAARQALGSPRVQKVPSVMPTGNAPAPAVAARDTIVNSAASQAAAQGVTGPSTAPQLDMSMARGMAQSAPGVGSGYRGMLTGTDLEGYSTDDTYGTPNLTREGHTDRDLGQIYDTDLTAEESILIGRDKDFLEMKDLAGEDLLGGGKGNPNDQGGGDAGPGDGSEGGEGGDDGPSDFRTELEKLLLAKLNEDPTAVAREDALRSIMAQRQTQAGRGTGGMYAMHKLGMDTANEAARIARAEGFKDQMGAAKMGVGLEALDKADRMAVLDFVENSDLPPKAMAQFLQDYMGLSAEEAASIQASREDAEDEQKEIDHDEASKEWEDHKDDDGTLFFNSKEEMTDMIPDSYGYQVKKDENGNVETVHFMDDRGGPWKVWIVEQPDGSTYEIYIKDE